MKSILSNKLLVITLGLFYLLLFSMEAWFLGRIPTWVTGIFEIFLFWKMYSYSSRTLYPRQHFGLIGIVITLLIAIFWNFVSSFGISISLVLSLMIMCMLLRFSDKDKQYILEKNTKWFAILLTVSAIAWLINWVIPLPNYGYVYRAGDFSSSENYIFFTELAADPFRFKSVFLEPGHVSLIATFFVAANRFNFKNPYVMLLSLCIIPTFGLSGYVLFVMGYVLYSFEAGSIFIILKRFIPMFLIFVGAIFYFQDYNGGDNVFNSLIMERLEYDDQRGVSGNDRSNYVIDKAFDDAVRTGDFISGISNVKMEYIRNSGGNGAGAKIYTLQHGIIGSFFLLLGYFIISTKTKYRRWAFFLFLLYFVSFFQRAYFFWAAYYIPYICALAIPPTYQKASLKDI